MFAVLDLALGQRVLGQNTGSQARNLVGDQGQAATALVYATLKGLRVGGQRLAQEGAVHRELEQLGAQLVERAQRHIGSAHLLQLGQVLFQIFERVPELQREQPAQATAVARGGDAGLVKHLDQHRVAGVDQRRKPNQHLAGLANLEQLGKFAKTPAGVALLHSNSGRSSGRGRRARRIRRNRMRTRRTRPAVAGG